MRLENVVPARVMGANRCAVSVMRFLEIRSESPAIQWSAALFVIGCGYRGKEADEAGSDRDGQVERGRKKRLAAASLLKCSFVPGDCP